MLLKSVGVLQHMLIQENLGIPLLRFPLKEFSGCRTDEGMGFRGKQVCVLPLLGCAWADLTAAELLAMCEAWMKRSIQSVVVCGVI